MFIKKFSFASYQLDDIMKRFRIKKRKLTSKREEITKHFNGALSQQIIGFVFIKYNTKSDNNYFYPRLLNYQDLKSKINICKCYNNAITLCI